MTQLWLVRHGQTDWNLERRYQGQTDIPLNDTGREQARDLAARLAGQPFECIYASDLKRAYETAQILGQHLGLEVHPHRGLREVCFGEWEGKTVDQIRPYYKTVFMAKRDPRDARVPGGESTQEVAERMAAAASEIARAHPGGPVLVVSHGFSVATLICQARGFTLTDIYSYIPDNARPEVVDWGD